MQIAKSKISIKNIQTNFISYNFIVDSVEYTIQYNPLKGKGMYKLLIGVNGNLVFSKEIFSYQLSIKQAKEDLIRYI